MLVDLVLILLGWAVVGLVIYLMWVAANAMEIHYGEIPKWKVRTILIIGGPIVWLIRGLS